MSNDAVRGLIARFLRARSERIPNDALTSLHDLQRLQPEEPTWPKRILYPEPNHSETEDRLHLLYTIPAAWRCATEELDRAGAVPDTHGPAHQHRKADDEQALRAKLFTTFSETEIRRLMAESEIVELPAGGECFRQGDIADRMYVILEGSMSPIAKDMDGDRGEVVMGTSLASSLCF